MEYESKVTQRKEYLPIVVSLLGAPGMTAIDRGMTHSLIKI